MIIDESNNSTQFNITSTYFPEKVVTPPTVVTDEEIEEEYVEKKSSNSYFSSFFGPTKEQKRAKKELEEMKKSFNLVNEEGNSVSLPPIYLPSAWACLALFLLITLHVLFHLLCHWLVNFYSLVLLIPDTKINEKTLILVMPLKNKGKSMYVAVSKLFEISSTFYITYF